MNNNLIALLVIGSGGFAGAVLRFLISGWVTGFYKDLHASVGIALVNISGCLLIGIAAGLFEVRDYSTEYLRLFLFTGLLGGYTTFSTYIFDSYALGRQGEMLLAVLNTGGQVIAGLVFAWLGYNLVRWLV